MFSYIDTGYVILGVFGHFPKISKCPHAKNIIIIDTAFSFEDRSGVTVFFVHVNFQPRASKAPIFNFLQNGPYFDQRSWPLNGRMTVTVTGAPERKLASVGEWPLHIAVINL